MRLVTGGAGFIGSHLVDALVGRGEPVRVLDNLSTGRPGFLADHLATKRVRLVRGDVLKLPTRPSLLRDVDEVWHLAADADVRGGIQNPASIIRDGATATFHLLEAMRKADARRILFTSTSTVYGEARTIPTPEDYGPCLPISAYGAAKLAAEGFVSAYAGTYGFQAWIFRFANVVGPRLTHGVIHDFHRALRRNKRRLRILGDGTQEKSYLSTDDCVAAMLFAREHAREAVNLFNLGSRDWVTVRRIAQLVVEAHQLKEVKFDFTGGPRGWAGDVPRMRLSIDKVGRLGWKPRDTSEAAVRAAAAWVAREG